MRSRHLAGGFLTIREVQAAFALFGQKVMSNADVRAEFEALDEDGSGRVELREFSHLMSRLAALAQVRRVTSA